MKNLFYLIYLTAFLFVACSNNVSEEKNWVLDQENILTDNEEQILNDIIKSYEKETSNEIVIVTTDNIGEHKKMVFYAVELGNKLGVGKKEKNNGLIIVVSKTLKETFMATGLSTELILKDEICQRFVDYKMIPEFKKDNYFEGLKNGMEESMKIWSKK